MSEENWDDGPVQYMPPSDGNYSQNQYNERGHYSRTVTRSNFRQNDNRPNRNNFGNFQNDGPPRGNRSNFNSNRRSDEENETLYVPSRFVGRIIGRGGSKINELQSSSGARIQVKKGSHDEPNTEVQLYGDPQSIEKAKELIGELTSDQNSYSSRPQGDSYSSRPQMDSYSSRPQTDSHSSRPQTDSYSSRPQTDSYSSRPQMDTYSSRSQDAYSSRRQDNYSSRPQMDTYSSKPQYDNYQSNTQETQESKSFNWAQVFNECDAKADEEWSKYPPIVKQFYSEHPEVTKMTDEEVNTFRLNSNNIVVDRTFKKEDSKPIPKPVITFQHAFHNYPLILDEIAKVGFESPSPIQSQAWPVLLLGEDLIGIAQTGTGKTLAFLLPALIHIDGQGVKRDDRGGPAVLVMAPTRELALQIDKEVKKYQYKGITSVCLYGGASRKEQVKVVDAGIDIVIATPGRLNDLVNAGQLNVKTVTYVVLDEADRMLDMGFEPQIRKVMYAIRPTRQTVMTSATWPQGVRRLANSYMNDPVQVYIGSLDLAATHTVTQTIQIVPDSDEEKYRTLFEFLQNLGADGKVIVFCGKKARADELSTELALNGISCQTMHGDRDQIDREQALLDIANGTVQVLIATDLASRGLDIEDITHVINYDFPRNIEEYVHRVGRTGRAGRSGESISFFSRADWSQASELIKILEEAQQFVPEEIYKMAERYEAWKEKKDSEGDRGGRFGGGNRRGRW